MAASYEAEIHGTDVSVYRADSVVGNVEPIPEVSENQGQTGEFVPDPCLMGDFVLEEIYQENDSQDLMFRSIGRADSGSKILGLVRLNPLEVGEKDEIAGGDLLILYRLLCPNNYVGSVTGKAGRLLKSIELETNARVKIGDLVAGSDDRVITIYCYVKKIDDLRIGDDFDDGKPPVCSAQDALMGVHSIIAAASEGFYKRMRYKHECRLLVPKSQIGRIVGKGGSTIQRLRTKIGASIEVVPKDVRHLIHPCALEVDHLLTITGNPEAVSRSLFVISAMMYKFPPKEHIPLDTNVIEALPNFVIPSDRFYKNGDSYFKSWVDLLTRRYKELGIEPKSFVSQDTYFGSFLKCCESERTFFIDSIVQNRVTITQDMDKVNVRAIVRRSWLAPSVDFVQLCTDAAYVKETGLGGGGGVLRDHTGRVLGLFGVEFSGLLSVEEAEFRAFNYGLSFAAEYGFRRLVIASDCLNLVKALQGRLLVPEIECALRELDFASLEDYTVVHMPRETNEAAHILARCGLALHGLGAQAHENLKRYSFGLAREICRRDATNFAHFCVYFVNEEEARNDRSVETN